MSDNISRNRDELLNNDLNKCAHLFDEANLILKDKILPSTPIEYSNYDFSSVIENLNPEKENLINVENCTFNQLKDLVFNCALCKAKKTRKNILFGEGPIPSRLMIIGEGPGKDEDRTGHLFVGKSGQYLQQWLNAISLDMKKDVYLSNVVKCYSGTNPSSIEVSLCIKYLERQIQFVKPEAILVLGKIAANGLFKEDKPLKDFRGKFLRYKNIPVIVTYHPAAVLRNPQWKRPVWEDIKKIAQVLSLDIPSHSRR